MCSSIRQLPIISRALARQNSLILLLRR